MNETLTKTEIRQAMRARYLDAKNSLDASASQTDFIKYNAYILALLELSIALGIYGITVD